MDKMIEPILHILPASMAERLRRESGELSSIEEIRLRRGGAVALTVGGLTKRLDILCTAEELEAIFLALCGGSLYAHTDSLSEGFILFEEAYRVGVCGQVVTEGGAIRTVKDIRSLNIRIPHRVYGIGGELVSYLQKQNGRASLLIHSPPGEGKTTLLRDLALTLGKERRVSVIDSRGELFDEERMKDTLIDCLSGCPKDKGFSMALRVLSPEYILCDEIGEASDASALAEAKRCGVCVVATCHAEGLSSLLERPLFASLHEERIFDAYVGIRRRHGKRMLSIAEVETIKGERG